MAVFLLSEVGPVTAVQPTPAFISPAPVVSERSFDDFMKGMLKTAHAADERQKTQEKTSGRQSVFSPEGGRKKAASTERRSALSEPRRERTEAKREEPRSNVSGKTERPARAPKSETALSGKATVDIETDVSPEQTGTALVDAPVEETIEVVGEAVVAEAPAEGRQAEAVRLESAIQPIEGSVESAEEASVAAARAVETVSDEIEAPADWEPPLSHEAGKTGTESALPSPLTSERSTAAQTQPEAVKQSATVISTEEATPVLEEETDDTILITAREQVLEAETTESTPAISASTGTRMPHGEAAIEAEAPTEQTGKAEPPAVEIEKASPRDQDAVTLSAEATRSVQATHVKEPAKPESAETKPTEGDRKAAVSEETPDTTPARPEGAQSVVKSTAQPAIAKQAVASDSAPESASVTGMPAMSDPAPISPKRGVATSNKAEEATEADDGWVEESAPPSQVATAGEARTDRDVADDRSSIGQDGWAKGTVGASATPSRQTASVSSFTDRLQGAQDLSAPSATTPTTGAPTPAPASLSNQLEKVERLQELVERFDRHVLSLAGDKDKTLSITLEPKSLGKVVLNCREIGDRMAVEIVAENAGVRQLLQQQESAVRQLLEEHGYKMGAFDVRTQDRGGESSSFARRRGRNDENAETGGDMKWRGEVTGSPEVGMAPSHAPRTAGGIWVVA